MLCETVQRFLLDVDVFDLVLFDDVPLVQYLDSVFDVGLSILCRQHGTVRPLTKRLTKIEICDAFLDRLVHGASTRVDIPFYADSGSSVLPLL